MNLTNVSGILSFQEKPPLGNRLPDYSFSPGSGCSGLNSVVFERFAFLLQEDAFQFLGGNIKAILAPFGS